MFTLRTSSVIGIAWATLVLVATLASASTSPSLKVRLLCDATRVAPGSHLECIVLLENSPRAAAVIVPKVLLPFQLGFRPPVVVEFEATEGGRTTKLLIAPSAQSGRYDVGKLSSEELLELPAGCLFGWRYDLNGGDWLLPTSPATYEIRARLRVKLLQHRKDGTLEPAVRTFLGRHEAEARSRVMDGEWVSNEVTLEVVPAKSGDTKAPHR